MELSLDPSNASYRISEYQPGTITIIAKAERQQHNLAFVIMAEKLISPWGPKTFDDLTVEDFRSLLQYHPQVVLLGSGDTVRFLKPELLASLAKESIGIEVMTSAAACRTFNLLSSEGRNVAAAIFP